MTPYDMWLAGREDILARWVGPGNGSRGSHVDPPGLAKGQPAFGKYKPSETEQGYEPWSLQVLEIVDGEVVGITFFLDTAAIFPAFGLPLDHEG
jgi:RNA polymerase sigma-70 factor (ECF subfamily)